MRNLLPGRESERIGGLNVRADDEAAIGRADDEKSPMANPLYHEGLKSKIMDF